MNVVRLSNLLLLSLLLALNLTASTEYDFDKACEKIGLSDKGKNLKVVSKKNTSRSYVTVLKDTKTGKKFIIKQLKKISSHPLQVVQEMLGTYVVNWLGLNAQKVIIVPREEFLEFKQFKTQPATLHTYIDEKPIKNFRKFKKLMVRQIKLNSSAKDHGLNPTIIKSMAPYHDLPAIVAADTFLGIDDRHKANLLFSETLQRFCLIDMDYTYHSALVDACIKQIKKLINSKTKLSEDECKGLMRYKETLERLCAKFTCKKLTQLLNEFIAQAEIPEKALKSKVGLSYATLIAHIEKTTDHIEELIDLIDTLVRRVRKHKMA